MIDKQDILRELKYIPLAKYKLKLTPTFYREVVDAVNWIEDGGDIWNGGRVNPFIMFGNKMNSDDVGVC